MTVSPEDVERARLLVQRATEDLRERDTEIRRLQSLLEAVLAAAPPVVATEQGIIRSWSAGLEELTGGRAGEAVGRRLERLLPGIEAGDGVWRDSGGREWRVGCTDREGWRVLALTPVG